MLEKTDLKKYFFKTKDFISSWYVLLFQHIKPYMQNTTVYIVKNKEMIIKLSFPLLLILVSFYSCTSSQRTILQNISDIFKISDEIRFQYADKPDYWGLSTQKALKDKIISETFIKDGKIRLSGGEEVLIGNGVSADIIMPTSSSFDIILPHLNKAQCIAYSESKISEDNMVKLLRISVVNALGSYTFEWGGLKYQLPVNKYASKDICAPSDNTLIWTIQ